MSVELEADFVKALRLLHSRAKDSADILKSMLDEVLKQKTIHSNVKTDQKKPIKGIETPVIKSSSDFKKENEKKSNFEKTRSESFEFPPEKKRIRLDSPQTSRSTSSSPTPTQSKPIVVKDEIFVKIEEDSEATDIEDENTDAGEFAVEMGLACVICKQIDIAPNNQLVECQECHNLYHQECHKPPLIDQDVSDPRFVWYCAKCQKTLKKIAVKPTKGNNKSPVQTPTSTSAVSQFKEFATQGIKTPVKGETHSDSRLIQPFKRVESKVPVSNSSFMSNVSSSSSAKPIGLAALATLSRSSSVSSSTTVTTKSKITGNNGSNGNNSSTSTTVPTSSTSLLTNSEKRLQNIKKSKSGRQK